MFGRVLRLGDQVERIGDLVLEDARHVAEWLQFLAAIEAVVDLINHGERVPEDLDSTFLEQLRVDFDELQQRQQARVLTSRGIPPIARPESDA